MKKCEKNIKRIDFKEIRKLKKDIKVKNQIEINK